MLNIETAIKSAYPELANRSPLILNPALAMLRAISHEQEINQFLSEHEQSGSAFIEAALEHLDVTYYASQKDLENIPAIGRVIIIANHPMGAIDAFALLHLISLARQNRKVSILANPVLMHIPQLNEMLIPVDNITGTVSRESFRKIEAALLREEAVIIFPAGEVSRMGAGGVRDNRWKTGFLNLARRHQAPVLPIHVGGRNSIRFYLASLLYRPLGTLMLADEMMRAKGKTLKLTIGGVISDRSFTQDKLPLRQHARMFRKHLYRIAHGKSPIYAGERSIAQPESRQQLRSELAALQPIGETSDGKRIYLTDHNSSPIVVREIGRLREYTYRKVEEGSGKKRDLDHYDRHYRHIILWDDADLELVGAYRIGECATILHDRGASGLYMHELCSFSNQFCDEILPQAIELGRSFVQPRYWGSRALDYLWQGIGAYLHHHPEIRYMYGPVSISQGYPRAARDALVYFYSHYYSGESNMLRAIHPYHLSELSRSELKGYFSGDDFNADFKALRSYLKAFDVSVPTLFKQYSELCESGGIRIFDFGIDDDFGGCIDGYLLADVELIKASKRNRYIKG